jgi:RNA polymerase sigma-70 factor, ECF subfamily
MKTTDPPPGLVAFCEREHGRLVGALALYTSDVEVARELAQESLLRACRHWTRLRDMEHRSAWLHRVAINLANSYFRRRGAEHRAVNRHGGVPDPTDDVAASADKLAVRQALTQLPPRQRTAVVLRFYSGMTVPEIATAMELSDGTVKSHLHRGLAGLRQHLDLKSMTAETIGDDGAP